jgi:hypothetical protein
MRPAICAASALSAVLLSCWPATAQTTSLSDWSRVLRLEPATEVIVAVAAGGIGTYRMAFADDFTLILVRPIGGKLPPGAERAIEVVGANWPAVLGGREMIVDRVRVTAESLIDGGIRVGNVFRIPRAAVSEVRLPDKATVPDALMSVAAIGMLMGASAASRDYYVHNDPMRPPGLGAWPPAILQINDRPLDERHVVYRASTRLNPLSESAMQRILQSVGPLGRKR